MNCNGCIADTMAKTAIGNHQAFYIVLEARDLCKALRDSGECDQQQIKALVVGERFAEVTR